MRSVLIQILVALVWAAPASARSPASWMLELELDGRKIEGMPLAWSRQQVHLLGRDGRLWQFAPSEAAEYRKTSSRFRSYSTSELRAMLLRELGAEYEVVGTGHYLVVQSREVRTQWAGRFEELYRSFLHYFSFLSSTKSPTMASYITGFLCIHVLQLSCK